MFSVAPKTIKEADRLAVTKYSFNMLTLMKNAAKACFESIKALLNRNDKIVVLCGKGNNAGDAYELSRLLKNDGFDVTTVSLFDVPPQSEEALEVYKSFFACGGKIVGSEEASFLISTANVIIDGIFGVGFYGSIDNESTVGKAIISAAENLNCLKIAIDVPSGINSGDGCVTGTAFNADITLTLAFLKTGTLSYPAREFCGEIKLLDIGFPKELENEVEKDAIVPDDDYIKCVIPQRAKNTHKGSFGRLVMFCGSEFMTGAVILAAKAALRSGVGLVNIARNVETLKTVQQHLTEPIFSPVDTASPDGTEKLLQTCKNATAILVGCGLGNAECDKKAVFSVIKNSDKPIILDADGINAVSENILILREAGKTPILTPHPLEFSRLTGKSTDEIQADRIGNAKKFAVEFKCVLVLKGAATVVAGPDGQIAICTCGGPGLSKGGSGDVLAGLCASFVAQGIPAFESAVCAVYLHAKAGDILSKEISTYGLLPSDIPEKIARLLP